MPVLPTCLALVLCDRVVHHRDTGRADVLGAFWEIQMRSFPGSTGPFAVWVVLVSGAGRVPMRLRIDFLPSDRLDEEPILDMRFTMEFTDPRVVRMYVCRVDGLDLVSRGQYRVTLMAYDLAVVHTDFIAMSNRPPS